MEQMCQVAEYDAGHGLFPGAAVNINHETDILSKTHPGRFHTAGLSRAGAGHLQV